MAKLMLCCCVLVDACNVLVGFDDVKAADDVQQGIGPDTGEVLMQGWSNSMHASFNSVKINSLKRGHPSPKSKLVSYKKTTKTNQFLLKSRYAIQQIQTNH